MRRSGVTALVAGLALAILAPLVIVNALTQDHFVAPLVLTQPVAESTLTYGDLSAADFLAPEFRRALKCELPQDWSARWPGLNPDYEFVQSLAGDRASSQVPWKASRPGYRVLTLCPPFIISLLPNSRAQLAQQPFAKAVAQLSPGWRAELYRRVK